MSGQQNEHSKSNQVRFLLFNWHFAAKIALVVAAISCLAAVLVLHYITSGTGQNYTEVARYFSSSRRNIGPTLLAAGLILTSFASLITWLISLYASFYIAGPLFRFARNLETLIEAGPASLIPTRKTDRLKREEQLMMRSVSRLQQHYSHLRALAEAALSTSDQQEASQMIERLKNADLEIRL